MEPIPDKANFIDFLDAPTEFNPVKNDLQNFITDTGQTVGGNNFQFSRAASGYSARATGYTDSGAVNAYVLTPQGSFKAPHAYGNFMIARFKAANTNTGASTVNVASLGVVPIKNSDGGDLGPGDIMQNEYIELWYFGGNFILVVSTGTLPDSTTGMVFTFASSVASKVGFLRCDGAPVSRTTYADLFAEIGVTWGPGDGSTTFNVPDLRGVVPRGVDDGRGLDPGRVFATYQADEFKSHNHAIFYGTGSASGTMEKASTVEFSTVSGDAGGVETRGKNTAIRFFIKT